MEHNPFSLSITNPEEYHHKIKHDKSIDKKTLNEIEDRASRKQSLNKDAASTTNLLRQKYILENADAHEIIELCKNPNLHEEIQVALASGVGVLGIDESDLIYTKRALARYNTNLCEKAQVILAQTEDDYILNRLAIKSNLSKEVQVALAKIDNEDVHYELANNFNLCKEAQELLIGASLDIRKTLAANPNLAKEMQIVLAKDSEKIVRLFLLDNVNLFKEAEQILEQDESLSKYLPRQQNILTSHY